MNSHNLLEVIADSLSPFGEYSVIQSSKGELVIKVTSLKIEECLMALKKNCGFIQLVDIIGIDEKLNPEVQKRFQLVYVLYNFEEQIRAAIEIEVGEAEIIPSCSHIWCNADWAEREIYDLLGIQISKKNKITKRIFFPNRFTGHPLRKDFESVDFECFEDSDSPFEKDTDLTLEQMSQRTVVTMGPQQSGDRGAFRLWMEMEDDLISRIEPELGFIHRGIEKLSENQNLNRSIHLSERLNYLSPSVGSLLWCRAIEEMIAIDIPERAKAIRMILLEMSRIIEHCRGIHSIQRELKLAAGELQFSQIIKTGERLLSRYSTTGHFSHLNMIGGMSRDLPHFWMGELMEWIRTVERHLFTGHESLKSSQFWYDQNSIKGIMASEALEWGVTGPILRSCGVNFDLRKAEPFYFYQDVDFEIPLGINGTSFDIYLVKVEEIKQSLNILAQVADNLPVGDFVSQDQRISFASKEKIKEGDLGAMARNQRLINIGPTLPQGKKYTSLESPNGELGLYLIGGNSAHPLRVKWRTPSFYHFQPFSNWAKGLSIDSARVVFESLNILTSEVDR